MYNSLVLGNGIFKRFKLSRNSWFPRYKFSIHRMWYGLHNCKTTCVTAVFFFLKQTYHLLDLRGTWNQLSCAFTFRVVSLVITLYVGTMMAPTILFYKQFICKVCTIHLTRGTSNKLDNSEVPLQMYQGYTAKLHLPVAIWPIYRTVAYCTGRLLIYASHIAKRFRFPCICYRPNKLYTVSAVHRHFVGNSWEPSTGKQSVNNSIQTWWAVGQYLVGNYYCYYYLRVFYLLFSCNFKI